ncbi:MAG: Ig-like domain-containing protein, partial [Erysipelotrichaceae bacterium]|nr:Ig-like domain-containing protein [Erysipelotrichaceae bacterium]
LDLVSGDEIEMLTSTNYLDAGGNSEFTMYELAKGIGYVLESDVPYDGSKEAETKTIDDEYAYLHTAYRLTEAETYAPSDRNAIKNGIMEHGALAVAYRHENRFYNEGEINNTYSYNCSYPEGSVINTNHAVTLVGWDDNYSKDNFIVKPSSNGAWLIKNSYGNGWGDDGYFWLSYEDAGFNKENNKVYAFDVKPAAEQERIYQYDGGMNPKLMYLKGSIFGANIYTAQRPEILNEVGLYTFNALDSYDVKVYVNPTEGNPKSGTLYATTSGIREYPGYVSVPLTYATSNKVIEKGDTFSIVLTITSYDPEGRAYMYIDKNYTPEGNNWFTCTTEQTEKTSYYSSSGTTWADYFQKGITMRIKGFATPAPITSIDLGDDVALTRGDKMTFAPLIVPAGAEEEYTYSTSDPTVCTINNAGELYAIGAGTCTVTVTAENGATDTVTITVAELDYPIEEITITDMPTLEINTSETLVVTTNPSDTDEPVYYLSSDPSVISVEDGVVTAHKLGTATITVYSTAASDSVTISVTSKITDFTIDPMEVYVDGAQDKQLTLTYEPVDTTDSKVITWVSSDDQIAVVDTANTVKYVGDGVCTITGTTVSNVSKTITVHAGDITGLTVTNPKVFVTATHPLTLQVAFVPADCTSARTLSYSSSDET